jgi:hypothetical protein
VSISSGVNTITYRRSVGSNYISANGGAEQELVNLGDEDFTITYIGRYTSTYSSLTVYDLSIATEQFQFREGQGITTTGSLGTTATINTANAGGVEYINEQVWNVDSNKYIDYE